MLQKLSYKPDIQSGVLVGVKRNVIVLSDDPATGFDNPVQLQEYVKVRKIPTLVYRDIEGDPKSAAQQYAEYYSNLEAVAIPWEPGMTVKPHQAHPISHNGKLYDVIQGHTTQSDWTPNIVPALFSESQAPSGSGYPEWVQPTGAHDAYQIGDRVTFNDKNYESIINANVWSPVAYPAGWRNPKKRENIAKIKSTGH